MKTGRSISNRNLPEVFYITLQGLDAILKRVSFKDSVLFKHHNSSYEMNDILFNTGVYFNLFSEYGIGKKLEQMTKELLQDLELEPEKYLNNIFYQEIIRLSPEISILLKEENAIKETTWSYEYAIKTLTRTDEISRERLKRIAPLFRKEPNLSEIIEVDENLFEVCNCGFCQEFRKYKSIKNKDVNRVILDVLFNIKDT